MTTIVYHECREAGAGLRIMVLALAFLAGCETLVSGNQQATVLRDGSFDQAGLEGWRVFTTPNGVVGPPGFPHVTSFDVGRAGERSPAVQFQVGMNDVHIQDRTPAGGGIFTRVQTPNGRVDMTVDLAVTFSSLDKERNLEGGVVRILLDGRMVAEYVVGPIRKDTTIRHQLHARESVSAGTHELRILIVRPFGWVNAPFQYIDNVAIIHHGS